MTRGAGLLLLHRLPGDVAAAEAVRPLDAVDRLIGARLRLAHVPAHGTDIQHAAAIGENGTILCHRAGVEDLDALDLRGVIEPLDPRALAVVAGIALRRHHHRQRRLGIPAQIKILQLAVAGRKERRHDVGHHPQHQHLALGIAEADIVLEQFWALRRQHHAGIEHAAERRAALFHAGNRRQNDPRHDLVVDLGRDERRRRIGAHAAGVRTFVVVEHALVVLRRRQRDRGLAVAQCKKADLAARQKFLDHDLGARGAERALEHHGDGGLGLGQRLCHHDALAGGKPIGLDHDRRALRARVSERVARHCRSGDRRRSEC